MAILSTTPSSLATNVVRNVALSVAFDTDLDRNSVTSLTVFLRKSSDGAIIPGVVDYIPGTKAVTFQLVSLLESKTEYALTLVGRAQGIRTLSLAAALPANYNINFTTGTSVDYTLPLAPSTTTVSGIQSFDGGQGVYDITFGQTGEPVSHVVTTAGQIGPSGNIVPAPFSSAVYLSVSGTPESEQPISIISTEPENGTTFLNIDNLDNIVVTFDAIPVNSGLTDDGVTVVAEDLLEQDIDQPTWTLLYTGRTVVATPSEWRAGSKYTVTVDGEISKGTEESELGEDYSFSFTTKPVIYFTTVKMVRINIGSIANDISDESIQLLIYENSLWAYENFGGLVGGSASGGFDETDPPSYVKEYVLCKTKLDVMNTILMGTDAPTSEQIGEVEFRYGAKLTERFKEKIDELNACIIANKNLILNAGSSASLKVAVRGYQSPGRPGRADTWKRLDDRGTFRL